MTHLSMSLLGQPRIDRDGVPVDIDRRKAIALLTFLAVTGERHTREKLAGLFWPEESQSAALASLRNNLTSLRHAIGEEWIDTSAGKVGLSLRQDLWLDVRQFSTLLARYEELAPRAGADDREGLRLLTEMAQLYRTNFLSQFTIEGAAQFSEWKYFQAEELRRKFEAVLERLAAGHARAGEPDVALAYARRRLALDPLDEAAHRALMRLYAATSRRPLALRQYATCKNLLREELQCAPETATSELDASIRSRAPVDAVEPGWADRPIPDLGSAAKRAARGVAAGASKAQPASRRWKAFAAVGAGAAVIAAAALVVFLAVLPNARSAHSVAILPFEVRGRISGTVTQSATAVAEQLAVVLVATGRMTVKAPQLTAEAWRGNHARAGRDLGVSWLVTGSVTMEGGRALVAVQLVRARSGVLAWAESYDRDWSELSLLEHAAALSAAEGIESTIFPQR